MITEWKLLFENSRENTVYHSSLERFERPFHPLTHFGTRQAALHRGCVKAQREGREEFYLHCAIIGIDNAIRMHDIRHHSAIKLADYMFYDHSPITERITSEERQRVIAAGNQSNLEGARAFARIMKGRGYDGIVYDNLWEGKGDSYIILDDAQVEVVVAPYPVTVDAALYSLKHDY